MTPPPGSESYGMPAKVVDASVMAAWCFGEPRAEEALELMRNFELHAPLLLAYELTSVARRKSQAYPKKAELLSEALRVALGGPIRWHEVDHPKVLSLALETNLTSYDACYLFLARALGMRLVTFDDQLTHKL
jgi:predicted nucleic acid-binding protein